MIVVGWPLTWIGSHEKGHRTIRVDSTRMSPIYRVDERVSPSAETPELRA